MSAARALLVILTAALAACGGRAARSASAASPGAPAAEQPRLTEEERQLSEHFLPGCGVHTSSTDEELVLYCPDQAVFFAVKDADPAASPDRLFNEWLEELGRRTNTAFEVLERSEAKDFGSQAVALYLRLRTPEMPADGFVEAYVARTEFNGKAKRVWCTATPSEPAGLARCHHDLMSVAVITAR